MDIFYIILGLLLIIFGANFLTDGSAAAAKRLKISEFIIGLTIVAVGTSMPEMVVSVLSALDGNGTISIGNVVGSNTFNTLVALGFCAMIRPIQYSNENMRRDIPFGILASAVLLIATYSGVIHRSYGIVMLLIYAAIIFNTIKGARRAGEAHVDQEDSIEDIPTWRMLLLIVGGFAALIFGGDMLLDGATTFARRMGISEKIIAITMLAGGTSLPEFAASLIALIKGKSGIALGNIVGSNIANILLVLGLSSTITPLYLGGINNIDLALLFCASALTLIAAFTPKRLQIGRLDGAIFIVIYIAYLWHMIGSESL